MPIIEATEKSTEEKILFYLDNEPNGFRYLENPVQVEEFVLSDKYLNLKDTIRPVVLEDLKELFCDEKSFAFCPYEEAVFDEAVGSGKSYKTSIILCYILHHLLCIESPQKSFGLDPFSLIAIMNMSVNETQAKKVVFGETTARLNNSRWFMQHRPDPNIRSELRFMGNITVIPGKSGSTFPLGYNLIAAVMDEAAYYTETATHDVAEDMFYTLRRRIETRFGKNGLLVMISQPRYIDDFIEKKYEEAKNDPVIFSRRRAIWEVVPEDIMAIERGDYFILDEVKIPNRYKKDFDKNPEKAWRDLGARPAKALEPYIKRWTLIEECYDEGLKHPFDEDGILMPWFQPIYGVNYYIHIDLGVKRDACGMAMAHADEQGAVLDFVHQIKPEPDSEVDIEEVENIVLELKKREFDLMKVTYDQFQSMSSIQRLTKKGIDADRMSVEKLEECETFKEKLYSGQVRMYEHPVLKNEMQRLELVKGKKVDHPVHGSKDCWDAACGAVVHVVLNELDEEYADAESL